MPNSVVRALTEDDAAQSSSVTTIARQSAPAPLNYLSFDRFNEQYNRGPDRKWEIEVQKRLIEFVSMPVGWDSYGAPPIQRDAGFFALEILNSVMRPRTPIPQIVPSSVGGIQLEWHEKDIDLELHITGPYRCEVWFRDRRGGAPVSGEITDDFTMLARPILELSSR